MLCVSNVDCYDIGPKLVPYGKSVPKHVRWCCWTPRRQRRQGRCHETPRRPHRPQIQVLGIGKG